jgi:hydroxypyruvate reductase
VARVTDGVRGNVPETPKPNDLRLAQAVATVIGSRRDAMKGATSEARARGYQVIGVDDAVLGEARTAGPAHLRVALEWAATVGGPICVVSSGETTVHVTGSGKGGRNQELALACAAPLSRLERDAVLASVGTDGIDGPTDAAGAVVDTTTLGRAAAAGVQPDAFLARNDAYAFFERLGDLIHTGPTGTNVGDIQVFLLG